VLACAFAVPLLRADEFSQMSHYSTRLFSFGTLTVDTRIGDIDVEGWDEPRVEIEAEKVVRARTEEKARRLYHQIRIEIEGSDTHVRLRTVYPPRRPWRLFRGGTKLSVNFRIFMPYDAHLSLKCVNGDVRIRGLTGHQHIRATYGNVEINLPSLDHLRSLKASTWLGYVQSDLRAEEGAGIGRRILFTNPQGTQDIEVNVRLGGIYVYGRHD